MGGCAYFHRWYLPYCHIFRETPIFTRVKLVKWVIERLCGLSGKFLTSDAQGVRPDVA